MSLLSANPEERETTLRAIVRRALADGHTSDTDAARALGRSRQRFERQLRDDETAGPRLADLVVLERLCPGLVGELVRPLGLRVAPEVAAGAATDVMVALAAAMNALAKVTTDTTEALADGIDGAEAHRIIKGCAKVREKAGAIEASVAAAVGR